MLLKRSAFLILCSSILAVSACVLQQLRPPTPFPPPLLPPPPLLNDWYTYHYNGARTGVQPWASALSDPDKVRSLHVKWSGPGGPTAVAGPFVDTLTVLNEQHVPVLDEQHFSYRDSDGVIWDSFYSAADNTWDLRQINVGNFGRGGPTGPKAIDGPFISTFAEQHQQQFVYKQHFVYLAANGEIWDTVNCPLCDGDNWQLQKINHGGLTDGPLAAAAPFVDVFTGHNQQHFVYRDPKGVIWDAFYCPDCDGNQWRLQQINFGGLTSGPLAAAGPFVNTFSEQNQQHFAYLAGNGDIWDAFFCPDCNGNQWRLQKINDGGVTSGPPAGAGPFINIFSGHSQQHFVYRDPKGVIWDAFNCPDCGDNKWQLQQINMNGMTTGPLATTGPFVNNFAENNQQHFAYLAGNGDIWDAFYCPDCDGSKWKLQQINDGGLTAGPPASAAPFVDVYSGHNQQHFAYLNQNGEIWDSYYCPDCDGDHWRLQQINAGGIGGAKVGAFYASPIVVNGTVFIGSDDGYFYALNAANGAIKWQYPKAPARPLVGKAVADLPLSHGIRTSASYWDRLPNGAIILSAQDSSLGPKGSDARLFALDAATGDLIWTSSSIASITGATSCSTSEFHQLNRYSSPLLFNGEAYVGIANQEDPIGIGRAIAVRLSDGAFDHRFNFQSVPDRFRGGGIWNGLATDDTGIFFTTGNVKTNNCSYDNPKPDPDHSLSMVRVDSTSGAIQWAFQPVPFELDNDADWAAGATVMSTSCGEMIVSVQKDGWTWALDPAGPNPLARWAFPTGPWWSNNGFQSSDGTYHGDSDYRRPGAAWGDVFIVRTGGENLVQDTVVASYAKLHALNACATTETDRVRWVADIPNTSGGDYSVGAPTATGGVVFVGTDQGHLVVFADPSILGTTDFTCSNPDFTTPADCTKAGFNPQTPSLKPIVNISIPDGGSLAAIRSEPVLVRGQVFIASGNGHVYMLEP